MKKKYSTFHLGVAIAVGSAMVFGFWPTAVRGIYANGGNVVFAVLLTTWARGLSMAGFCLLTGRPLFGNRREARASLIGGFFQAICLGSMYAALLYLPGPIAIIILFSHTLMLLFYMAWRGEIKLDRLTILTTIVALAGLSVVLDIWHKQPVTNIWGIALAFVGAVTTASRLYVFGRQVRTTHPITVGAENFLLAALFLMLILYFKAPVLPTTPAGYEYALAGCIVTSLGTFGMFYGIALMGSFRWSLFLKMEPVFTSLFSAYFLHEILKPHQYLGMLIVIGSLAIYQIAEHRHKIDLA